MSPELWVFNWQKGRRLLVRIHIPAVTNSSNSELRDPERSL